MILTACEMSCLVNTITYIKLSIAFEYGAYNIYSCSASIEGDNFVESIK